MGDNHILFKRLGTHLNDWNYGQPGEAQTNVANQSDPVAAFYAQGQRSITNTRPGFNDTAFIDNLFNYLEKNTNINIADQGVNVVSFSSGTVLAEELLNNPSTKDRVNSMVLGCPTNFYPKKGPLETKPLEVLRPGKEDVPMLAFLGGKDKLVPPKGGSASRSWMLFPFGHTNLRYSEPQTAIVVRTLRNGGDGSYKVIEDTPGYQVRQFKSREQSPTKVVVVR